MITVNGEPLLMDGGLNRRIIPIVEGVPLANGRKFHDVPHWSGAHTRHRMTCTEWRMWCVLPDAAPGLVATKAARAAGYQRRPAGGAPNHVYHALHRLAERGILKRRKVRGRHGLEYRFWRAERA